MVATEKAWEKLSPEQFESLVFALLNREGYMNGEWYGRPKEYVQDIVCYRFTIDGPPELFQKYVAMCKHDKESLTKYRLNKDLEQIRKHSPYCVIVAANLEVSDYKKKVIKDLEKNDENTFQILLWEKPEMLKMVEEHQDLRWHFLGVEIDDLHKLPGIRNVLARCNIERISDELCDLLKRTYGTCLQHGRIATNTALLASFLENENELVNSIVAGNQFLRKELQEFIEEVNSDQTESGFPESAIKLTDSFVKTMILANRLSKEIQRPNLDEKVFLYSLLKISDSETIRLLSEKFSSDALQAMEGALFCNNFDIDEQDQLKRFFADCSKNRDLMLTDVDRSLGEDLGLENLDFCLDASFGQGVSGRAPRFVLDLKEYSDYPEADSSSGDPGSLEVYRGKIHIEPDLNGLPPGVHSGRGLGGRRRMPGRRAPAAYNYYYDMKLDNWFSRMMSFVLSKYKKMTDLYIFPEKPVQIRSEGKLHELELESYSTAFSHFQTEAIACMLLNKAIVRKLLANTGRKRSISFAYQMKGHQSFRVTIMAHAVGVSLSFRKAYPPLWAGENLFFSDPLLSTLLDFEEGIVIVAGKPSSGKTTFMNAMINAVNQKTHSTIVTLENPVETYHAPSSSSVMQLQKGVHFDNYEEAALFSMKSGADLIVVDELKDAITCRACIDASQSGVLAVATINARSCREAFDRVLYMCDAENDPTLKSYLSRAVKRIICLTLGQNEKDEFRASFEVVDLGREMENDQTGGDSDAPSRPVSANPHRPPRIFRLFLHLSLRFVRSGHPCSITSTFTDRVWVPPPMTTPLTGVTSP